MKIHIYITNAAEFLQGNYRWCFGISDADDINVDGWFLAGEVEVELDVNNETITQFAVNAIDKAEQEEIAEHQVKMDMLKEKKANLLSITHTELT